MNPRSCVGKNGKFIVGIHQPYFDVKNLRPNETVQVLGSDKDGTIIDNQVNFPKTDLSESNADTIYEIANAFAFRGTTFINSAWANAKAKHLNTIKIGEPEPCSLLKNFQTAKGESAFQLEDKTKLIDLLPHPLLIALAQASTDQQELSLLAQKSCDILFDNGHNKPIGLVYIKDKNQCTSPHIFDHELFEVVVNNPYLPDGYKNVMVLKPGVQGNNEITAEYLSQNHDTHVFEYLRRNSYIPWGHFASNMANDAIRYSAKELSFEDMTGIRHLYYQRAYSRMAQHLDIPFPDGRKGLTQDELETLRKQLIEKIIVSIDLPEFDTTLWGWNFGFGYAQSGHRLHASHQMIHQQNAMIPRQIPTDSGETVPTFACGDQVDDFITQYKTNTGKDFFKTYLNAIRTNTRTDGNKTGPSSLIVAEGETALLFVPKAQISEFELQLVTKKDIGNIFQADTHVRNELDKYILSAVKILEHLGVKMVTSIEYSKRFNRIKNGQHLLYSFIPRLPYAPGTFSEAQLRWISGLYPEDFAQACRTAMSDF